MLVIPLQPVSSQTLKVVLDNQNCQITIQQKPQGVFVDLNADGTDIVLAALAQEVGPIVSRPYTGFRGNLMFLDTQGNADPEYIGMGTRWQLCYLGASEYAVIQ